jgi:hypothetical protein
MLVPREFWDPKGSIQVWRGERKDKEVSEIAGFVTQSGL